MKIYLSTENIIKKIESLDQQIQLIGAVPGNYIPYVTAREISNNLIELRSEYKQELTRRKFANGIPV